MSLQFLTNSTSQRSIRQQILPIGSVIVLSSDSVEALDRMSWQMIPVLDQYSSYLRALADMQLNPRLRVKEDVSDVVQQRMLGTHRDFTGFRGTTDPELRTWLKTILTRKLINLAEHYATQKCDVKREISIDQQLHESAARIGGQLAAKQNVPQRTPHASGAGRAVRRCRGRKTAACCAPDSAQDVAYLDIEDRNAPALGGHVWD